MVFTNFQQTTSKIQPAKLLQCLAKRKEKIEKLNLYFCPASPEAEREYIQLLLQLNLNIKELNMNVEHFKSSL